MKTALLLCVFVLIGTAPSCIDRGDDSPSGPGTQSPIQVPLVNGSFEDGPWIGTYLSLDSGSTVIPGWVVSRGKIDVHVYWQSYHGLRSLDLDGTPGAGGISQTISTVPGGVYRVSFAMAGNPEGSPAVKSMAVGAANQLGVFTFDVSGKSISAMGWQTRSWTFTARDNSSTIEFWSSDQGGGLWGPALDSVSVFRIE
jgi:choice-of-anchor C domain-containing protein